MLRGTEIRPVSPRRCRRALGLGLKSATRVKQARRPQARSCVVKPETQSFYELAVRRAVERVLASLDEALDLERLARHAALSPFHFHRIFRGMLGETPLGGEL
jgi:transcriptional regulator GlxA family with amidase domain